MKGQATSRRTLARSPSRRLADVASSIVTKAATVFAVCSPDGDIDIVRNPGHGVYYDDMRHLDHMVVRLDGQPLGVLLAQSRGHASVHELANQDIQLRE